ncbi:hypothetical protein SKAU_G00029620 [Synaphobranchus kaupii]|uniref:Uncharacterized protein n=1 Tax=Synaphobranchus kaupii TaxID=118154 RepID=A0A9Q1JFX1_SYNKA|nr:hypothetical protein SKAU_G00029620 [Synaphobranchus kaupii]
MLSQQKDICWPFLILIEGLFMRRLMPQSASLNSFSETIRMRMPPPLSFISDTHGIATSQHAPVWLCSIAHCVLLHCAGDVGRRRRILRESAAQGQGKHHHSYHSERANRTGVENTDVTLGQHYSMLTGMRGVSPPPPDAPGFNWKPWRCPAACHGAPSRRYGFLGRCLPTALQ